VKLTDEMLMAYADGELDAAARAQVEAAMAADPDTARRVADHQRLREAVRRGFDAALDEPVPERLLAAARAGSAASAQVLPFRRPPPRRTWPQWGTLAAGMVLGILVWQLGAGLHPALIASRGGDILATGPLAQALDMQLAATQPPDAAVHIGLTFRARDGRYCRTFQLRAGGTAGLACNDQGWKLEVLARGEAQPGEYRQAGSALPPAVTQAVTDTIAGDPLDAAREAQARSSGWRAAPR
jgi:hypothetical protein